MAKPDPEELALALRALEERGKELEKEELLTQRQAARRLKITERALRNHGDDPPHRYVGRHRKYLWPALKRWHEEMSAAEQARREKINEQGEPQTIAEARAALMREKAIAQRMENERRRGELVDVTEMDAIIVASMEEGARLLKAAPRKLAKQWSSELGVPEARAITLIEGVVEGIKAVLRSTAEKHAEERDDDAVE